MPGQGHGSIKPRGIFGHANIPCHMLQGIVPEDWDFRRAGIKSLECQAKQLGLYQQATGS